MSVDSKMTAIANEIRTLHGSTEKLGLDAMATQVNAANATVDAQASLIAQIQTALESKTAVECELKYATGSGAGNTAVKYTGTSGGQSTAYVLAVDLSALDFKPAAVIWGTGTRNPSNGSSYYMNSAIFKNGGSQLLTFVGTDTSSTYINRYIEIMNSGLSSGLLYIFAAYSSGTNVNYYIVGA